MYKVKGADSNEYGPITLEQVRQWIQENRLNRHSLAEKEGDAGWKPLSQFPEFAADFASSAPAFAAPVSASPGYSTVIADPIAAAARLKAPAILLIIFAVLGFLMTLAGPFLKKFWMDSMLHFIEQMNVQLPPETRNEMESASKAGFQLQDAFGLILGLVVNTVILLGGFKMLKVQTWGLCLAAAILIMLPCGSFCCCVGLPLGIWMIMLLNKPEVKSSFR